MKIFTLSLYKLLRGFFAHNYMSFYVSHSLLLILFGMVPVITGVEQTANAMAGFGVAADDGDAGKGMGVSPSCSARGTTLQGGTPNGASPVRLGWGLAPA